EGGGAARQRATGQRNHAAQRTRQHHGRVIAVIGLVVGRESASDVQCSDIRRGGGNRVQHVVASIGTRQARTGQGHRLAAGHVLVAEGGRAARQTNRVRADCAAKTARRHRGGVVAVVLFAVRREAAGDVLGSDVSGGRRYGVEDVVGGVGAAPARACRRCSVVFRPCFVIGGGGAARVVT